MKKKILVILLIIILSLALGLGIRFLTIFIKNKQIEKYYITFIGAVEKIDNAYVYVLPEDNNLKNNFEHYYFPISEKSEHAWKIGDRLEVKYHKDFLGQDGFMPNTILKYLGKTRLFRNVANVQVSNSNYSGGNLVFKSFYQYEDKINLEDLTQVNDYLVKKIVSYDEYLTYQELMPELRTLTEDDFVHYHLLVLLSKDASYLYTLEGYDETETDLSLSVLKHATLSSPESDKEPLFAGVSVVVPNRCDFDFNKIKITTTSTKK